MHAESLYDSRFIWLDFLPIFDKSDIDNTFSALIQNIYRYAVGGKNQGLATWPQGKRMAAFVSQDVDQHFSLANDTAEVFIKNRVPISWYTLGNLANQNHYLTKKLSGAGEVACHGDDYKTFSELDYHEQHTDLSHCKETLSSIIKHEVLGFRPPNEAVNKNTYKAIESAGLDYLFARVDSSNGLPLIWRVNNREIVQLPRINSNGFNLWSEKSLNLEESISQLSLELAWIKRAGALFNFSFRTTSMLDKTHLRVIEALTQQLVDPDIHIDTAGGVATWWLYRNTLLNQRGKPNLDEITDERLDRFQPYWLETTESGEINRSPLTKSALN